MHLLHLGFSLNWVSSPLPLSIVLGAMNKLLIIANSSENSTLITKSNQNKEIINFSFTSIEKQGFRLQEMRSFIALQVFK
jgi:hypothetical protein